MNQTAESIQSSQPSSTSPRTSILIRAEEATYAKKVLLSAVIIGALILAKKAGI